MTSKTVLVAGALALAFASPFAALAAGQQGGAPGADLMFTVGYVQSNLVKGKSTRADVVAAFGDPTHQKVRATDSGSTEMLYYQRGAAAQQSDGGGVAKATRGIGAIAGGLSRMMGYNNSGAYQAARVSNQADNIASGMEMLSGAGGSNAAQASTGPNTLTVELRDGVVASYSLE